MLSSEAAADVLGMVVFIECILAVGFSVCYTIPYFCVPRIRSYRKKGSAHRLFAFCILYLIAAITLSLVSFLAAGFLAAFLADTLQRVALIRSSLVIGITVLCVLCVLIPVAYSYIEDRSHRERKQLGETE